MQQPKRFAVLLLAAVCFVLLSGSGEWPVRIEGRASSFDLRLVPDSHPLPVISSCPIRKNLANQGVFCSECFELSKCLVTGLFCTTTDTSQACMTCDVLFCVPCIPA